MSDKETNTPQPPEPPSEGKSPNETDAVKSAPASLGEEELKKYLKGRAGKETVGILSELIQGQKVAAVYIDARSGGVFFQGEAKVGGDVVGRDQAKSGARIYKETVQAAVGQVLANDLKKINTVYLPSPLYDTAQKKITKNRLLLLYGRAHTGKWTTALQLLSKQHPDNVVELDPAASQEQIIEAIDEARGYIIDSLSIESAERLTPFSLSRLSERLREKGTYLAITLDERVNLPSHLLATYGVYWEPPTDTTELLKKHLAWYAPQVSAQKRNRILAENDVKPLLEVRFLPGEIDRLAELLGEHLKGEFDLASALSRFTARAREQVKNWFDENTNLEDRLFMLSVSIFNGASYQSVNEAEKRLQALFPQDDTPTSPSAVFGSSRGQRVRRIGAQLKQGFTYNDMGRVPIEIIELDNPSIQPATLQFAWNEYDRLRDIMSTWLYESVFDAGTDVRIRAAAAVGELCKQDFHDIRRKIILPWSNHPNPAVRSAAAFALGIPAWESETAPLVLNLLHHWSTLKNNWKLCWTACAAHGGLVGLRFPDAALRDLRHIAQTGDLRLLDVLSQSMNNLFDAGETVPEYHSKVLAELHNWAQETKNIDGIFAIFIFLGIAESSRQKADPEGEPWPTILKLAGSQTDMSTHILKLWQTAFKIKASRSIAYMVFENWLKLCQQDMRLSNDCVHLAKEIIKDEGHGKAGRLHAYLTRWQSQPETEEIANTILKEIQI